MDIGSILFIILVFFGFFQIIKYIYISNRDKLPMSLDPYEDNGGSKNKIIIPFILTTILITIPVLFWWAWGI